MTPQAGTVEARLAIRGHLHMDASVPLLLPHLERIRDDELQAAQVAVQRSLSAIRTELALLAGTSASCMHTSPALRLEKDFQALDLRMTDVLELARLRVDEGSIQVEPLMLDQAVRAGIEDAAASLQAHGVLLDLQIQTDVPVTTDAARIREIALRFLDLGVRALESNDRLQLRVHAQAGRATLEAHAAGLAAAIDGSVGLRVCRTLAASLGARLEQAPHALVLSLPLRSLRARVPVGVEDLRFL